MIVCKVDDFNYTINQYRSEFIGKDQTGRKLYRGVSFKKTAWGDIEENRWYRIAKNLITIAGEAEVLEIIKEHCKKLVWLKKEEVENYAIECMLNRSYEYWADTKELSNQRTNKWVFYFENAKE